MISEFVARNAASLADENRSFPDWIEIHNPTGAAVDLSGWSLSNAPDDPGRWRFPGRTLEAGAYLVVFASGKDRAPVAGPLHTNFKLPGAGGYLALVQPDGVTIASEFTPGYPEQFTDISGGPNPDPLGPPFLYFERPTPAAPNTPGWTEIAGGVEFSVPGGVFVDPFELHLSSQEPGGTIRFTLDGSIPAATSPEYEGPILVDRTLRLRARVFREGRVPGPVAGAGYSRVSPSQQAFTSNLPILLFETHGQTIGEGTKVKGHLTIIEPGEGRAGWTNPAAIHVRAGIEIRGSSSTQFPKKSYGIELNHETGADRAEPLLGMPADADWVLYAPYTDKSLIRDVLAYDLSRAIGRYAPRTRFVEVYVNRADGVDGADYQGVYVLIEKVKGGGHRAGVPEVESTDVTEPAITGGYILKKDRLDPNDGPFTTPRGQDLGFEWPKPRFLGSAQLGWIQTYMRQFEGALYGSQFRDPRAGYAAFIDVDAFVDHHWLVEVAKNIDGFRLSTFMTKARGGPLAMGPIWDYNLSFGNANYLDGWNASGWYHPQLSDDSYPWYRRLFEDPEFSQRHTDRWASLRTGALATDRVLALVDGYTNLLAEAQDRNFKKWRILNEYVWPNAFIGGSYEAEIGFLKEFISNRLQWIDTTILRWPELDPAPGYHPDGVTLRITATGTVYYTLDGSDPRNPGGGVAPQARRYSGPVSLESNARVVARVRTGNRWSPPSHATYALTIPGLRITEIMYHPPDPPPDDPFPADDYEFLEFRNVGHETLVLDGFRLSGGISYAFTPAAGDLWPGENVVLAKHPDALRRRYGDGFRILGPYASRLGNASDTLILTGPFGESVLDFAYSDRWQPATDGRGHSLTHRDPSGPVTRWGDAFSWDQSTVEGGTPGRGDVPAPDLRDLAARREAGHLVLTFTAAAGQTFAVESAPALPAPVWMLVTNLPPAATSGPITVAVPLTEDPGSLYRVLTPRQMPPL